MSSSSSSSKDPKIIARDYQLRLCRRAVNENIIVYLGTGCGKTHIAVLLICELGHLIRKPQRNVCVFLAPTVHLVRQQAVVIEDSTDFKVGCYFGNSKRLRNHHDWEKEIDEHEVLVMTPQILLHNLQHCFIRMELIALLIFDECHHAQIQNRHPYAEIMKEFYEPSISKRPHIFGMTASPIIGKGGTDQAHYSKSINSLENLLDAKVCTVENMEELENLVASPHLKVYGYGPDNSSSSCILTYIKKLEEIKCKCTSMMKEKIDDQKDFQKNLKLLWRVHENLTFCLESLGLWGATQAVHVLSSDGRFELSEIIETNDKANDKSTDLYLTQAASVFPSDIMTDGVGCKSLQQGALEEPFFSKKLLVLIQILSTYSPQEVMKCIVFVKRIIVARSLAFILGNLKSLSRWKCEFLVGFHSGLKNMSRKMMNGIVEKFRSGKLNLLVATSVAEEGLDIQTCCLVIRFDLPETVTSFIQSRGRARMRHSEYVFLVDRGNKHDLNLINEFISKEENMNKEIVCRSSTETFNDLEEKRYIVDSTGASISSGSSVGLLHHYCSKLPRDEYFTPKPEFFFIDDLSGTVCRIILPANAPLHQVDGLPCSSKDDAKRNACLKACGELHALGALTDYLLPSQDEGKKEGSAKKASESDDREDETLRGDLHEMLVPAALRVPWSDAEIPVQLNFYFIEFIPIPDDRIYCPFGLFVKSPLPREAETMNVDLHLAHGRIVKAKLIPSGTIEFDINEIVHAQNFQEMFLKVILDRSKFFEDFVPLGRNVSSHLSSLTFYLLLPVKKHGYNGTMTVDWGTIMGCLSSPVFRSPTNATADGFLDVTHSLKLINGPISISDIQNSLVLTPHNKLLFFIDDILYDTNGNSQFKSSTYVEHYQKKFGINLSYPHQPLLKAKQLFSLRNLLPNRLQESTGFRQYQENFVELPPELCSLKIIGFSKDIGSSLSLLPSVMRRLENLLVAIELKEMLSSSFQEGSTITANHVLEALTTEKCLERFSLERFEVLGDSFLKYAVSRHLFLSNQALDEGQLTNRRSSIVNNSHLYELAIKSNLQVYIRDEWFDPCYFFALGRRCTLICNEDTEKAIHIEQDSGNIKNGADIDNVKCNRCHHWLHRKTVADVVEALIGAFIVDSGFTAATAFLRWLGIQVDYKMPDLSQIYAASQNNMSLIDAIDIPALEKMLGYEFLHKGLLLQAFIHPSYNKHSGGCYQRLEFLGDAVLDYLITSYLYSVYPDLKPGQLTDLSESNNLSEDIKMFVNASSGEKCLCKERKCPKVLGDLVESCAAAILLDTRFNLDLAWRIMFAFLDPITNLSSSCLQLSSIRELQELCQTHNFELSFPDSEKQKGDFLVEAVVVDANDGCTRSIVKGCAINPSRKVAKRMAAQEALSKLKAQGFKYKSKSLEEIVQTSRKQEGKLIGFDETLSISNAADTLELEKLQIGETSTSVTTHTPCRKPCGNATDKASFRSNITSPVNAHGKETEKDSSHRNSQPTDCEAHGKEPALPSQLAERDCGETSEASNHNSTKKTPGVLHGESARSLLYEFCNANFRSQPLFECCKEEGPSHLKLFTYKVTFEVPGHTPTILECLSSPMPKKKAAAEHAAEGALWYLRHLGYLPDVK
ncbi:hypothetical protein AAC387_Pa05g2523 [Persea americana]